MFYPEAKIICDSVNPSGDRLTTMELKMHRSILAQFNKHRLFSSNTASTRAIPIKRYIAKVVADDVRPLEWGANGTGMVPNAFLTGYELTKAKEQWLLSRDRAIASVEYLSELGVHKEIVNKLLDPFATTTVICTGDPIAWNNFLRQRNHSHAQAEIRALAMMVQNAYDESEPKKTNHHLPYSQENECDSPDVMRLCVARCARVSYLNHDRIPCEEDDLRLFRKLVDAEPPHLSPLEHVALSCEGRHANFTGWKSYRRYYEESKDGLLRIGLRS